MDRTNNEEAFRNRPMLYQWFVELRERGEEIKPVAHGTVFHSPKFPDATEIHTSPILEIRVNEDAEEALLYTKNSVYACPLAYCDFKKQDAFPELIPDYEERKSEQLQKPPAYTTEPGQVLLVLADFCKYYYHSLYCVPKDAPSGEPLPVHAYEHIGAFQDSFLIDAGQQVRLRYFPHRRGIEFYGQETDGMPIYLENAGLSELYARTAAGIIRLRPGERKEAAAANAEPELQEEVLLD